MLSILLAILLTVLAVLGVQQILWHIHWGGQGYPWSWRSLLGARAYVKWWVNRHVCVPLREREKNG